MNMSSQQLKNNGFYPITLIKKNIPTEVALMYCKKVYEVKDKMGRSIKHFDKAEVLRVFSENSEAISAVKAHRSKCGKEQRDNKTESELISNCSVSYKQRALDSYGNYSKQTMHFDNVDVLIKGNYAHITIGKSTIRKHIVKSSVKILNKYVS